MEYEATAPGLTRDALAQARIDAEFGSRTTNHEAKRQSAESAQAWALIAIAEQLEALQVIILERTGKE